MLNYVLDLGTAYGKTEIKINRKNIKNVHLKVYRDLSVVISAPINVPDDWLINFLENRKDWIAKQLEKYRITNGINNLTNLKNGSSTQILGKDMRIIIEHGIKNVIVPEEKTVTVYLMNPKDENYFNQFFRNWWRDYAAKVYLDEITKLYNAVFKKYSIAFPTIQIRKMDTLWGSCTKSRNKIVLNEYLLKADIRCIQYVILHELTHLLYDRHNSDFYSFLTIHMPDWKERKARLDLEVVAGL